MEQQTFRNLRLGLFVTLGTGFLVVAFYLIGSKQNLFGSTFRITAKFCNVNGLMEGNNVRFAGINIGTVASLEIQNDSTVLVTMIVDRKVQPFIRRSSIASVGTDGLMGNKLVNINGASGEGLRVEEGDELRTLQPLEMDEMVRTLDITNTNIAAISSNLHDITGRISNKNTFWKLMMDTLVAEHIKTAIVNLEDMSYEGKTTVRHLNLLTGQAAGQKSTIRKILADTVLYGQILQTVNALKGTGDSARSASSHLSGLLNDLKTGKGSIGQALRDTGLIYRLNRSLQSIDSGAGNFNENMVALQHTWPLKKYFKKRTKKK